MLTASLPKTFNRPRFYALHLRRLLPILLIGLIPGCASESPFKPTDAQAALPCYDNQAVYNKPYKVKGKTYYPLLTANGYREKGLASWYGAESGSRTAIGSRFKPKGLSAAHKTLPLPAKVRVTNLSNGRHIDLVVNDRGPFVGDRLIDLSQGAAKQIGMHGMTEVEIVYLES